MPDRIQRPDIPEQLRSSLSQASASRDTVGALSLARLIKRGLPGDIRQRIQQADGGTAIRTPGYLLGIASAVSEGIDGPNSLRTRGSLFNVHPRVTYSLGVGVAARTLSLVLHGRATQSFLPADETDRAKYAGFTAYVNALPSQRAAQHAADYLRSHLEGDGRYDVERHVNLLELQQPNTVTAIDRRAGDPFVTAVSGELLSHWLPQVDSLKEMYTSGVRATMEFVAQAVVVMADSSPSV